MGTHCWEKNTLQDDYDEMNFVRGRNACTLQDLIANRMSEDFVETVTLRDLTDPDDVQRKEVKFNETATCKMFKEAIKTSCVKVVEDIAAGSDDNFKADCLKMIHHLGDDPNVSTDMHSRFLKKMKHTYGEIINEVKIKKSNDDTTQS